MKTYGERRHTVAYSYPWLYKMHVSYCYYFSSIVRYIDINKAFSVQDVPFNTCFG
jgi:hypothetical protein